MGSCGSHEVVGVGDAFSTSRAIVAGCSINGKVHGEVFDGEASILTDTSRVQALEARKYGLVYRLFRRFNAMNRRLRRKPDEESVTIAVVPPPS